MILWVKYLFFVKKYHKKVCHQNDNLVDSSCVFEIDLYAEVAKLADALL